jgi:hypothetical protein
LGSTASATDSINAAIKLIAWNDAGDYTGGNAANSFRITLFYVTINPSTGELG